jgi:hypothetical protein
MRFTQQRSATNLKTESMNESYLSREALSNLANKQSESQRPHKEQEDQEFLSPVEPIRQNQEFAFMQRSNPFYENKGIPSYSAGNFDRQTRDKALSYGYA